MVVRKIRGEAAGVGLFDLTLLSRNGSEVQLICLTRDELDELCDELKAMANGVPEFEMEVSE